MTISLSPELYTNTIEILERAAYDKYAVTIFDKQTNEVFGSVVDFIGFGLEDKVHEALLISLNKLDIREEEINYIEYATCTLLTRLEDEHLSDEYHEQVILSLSDFRAKTVGMKAKSGSAQWIQSELPENVNIIFNKIDGFKAYNAEVKTHEEREIELREKFDKDLMKESGVNLSMYKFLTKSISKQDRTAYMKQVTSKVNEYIEVLAEEHEA